MADKAVNAGVVSALLHVLDRGNATEKIASLHVFNELAAHSTYTTDGTLTAHVILCPMIHIADTFTVRSKGKSLMAFRQNNG